MRKQFWAHGIVSHPSAGPCRNDGFLWEAHLEPEVLHGATRGWVTSLGPSERSGAVQVNWASQRRRGRASWFIGLHQCVPGYVCTGILQEAKRELSDSERSVTARQSRDRDCVGTRTSWKGKVGNCFGVFFNFSVGYLHCSRTTLDLYYLGFFVLVGTWHHCYIG